MNHTLYFTLCNGVRVPAIGFGTWQIPNGEICYNAVLFALKSGYRHIDTANGYANEESVGRAVRDSGIERSDIFVTSKLPAEIKTYEGTLERFDDTLKKTGFSCIDLYLIHAPWPWEEAGKDFSRQNREVWKAMENIYKSGRCRAIGVSNFKVPDLKSILGHCEIKPMVNQIKFFIGNTQETLTRFCQEQDILVEGYSPLATGKLLTNKKLAVMAQRYNTTPAQLAICYVLQRGVLPLPKSITPQRILQNLEVDFQLTDEDMKSLNRMKDPWMVVWTKKAVRFLRRIKSKFLSHF